MQASFTRYFEAKCENQPEKLLMNLAQKQLQNLSILEFIKKTLIKKSCKLLLNDNKLTSLEGLNTLSDPSVELIEVVVYKNNIQNLDALKGLQFKFLQRIYLEYNSISNIEGLLKCSTPCLIQLNLNDNNIHKDQCQHLVGINTPQLRMLSLESNSIQDIEFLKHCKFPKLIYLNLEQTGIKNVQALKYCNFTPNLSQLGLKNNNLEKLLCGYCNLQNLQTLSLSNNSIMSAEEVGKLNLKALRVIDLSKNLLVSVNFIKKLYNPKEINQINLSQNYLKTIENIFRHSNFSNLQILMLRKNNINHYKSELLCGLQGCPISTLSFWNNKNTKMKQSFYLEVKKEYPKLAFFQF